MKEIDILIRNNRFKPEIHWRTTQHDSHESKLESYRQIKRERGWAKRKMLFKKNKKNFKE